ncbi:MAG: hypothetical protein J2P41_22265, partial [Blastocatellia bacterium]|nr:hypothetical protein [Blastocatellia bacterium]
MLTRLAAIIFVLLFLAPYVPAQKSRGKRDAVPPPQPVTQNEVRELSEASSKSRSNLIEASKNYRESLEHLLELQKQEEEKVAALVERNRGLFASGVISKKEVEEVELKLADAQNKIAVTQRQLESVDHLVAEVNAAE